VQKPALVVVDVQQGVGRAAHGERSNPEFEQNLAAALEAWRAAGAPVIHVRDESPDPESAFRRGKPGFEFKPEARPLPGEVEIVKSANSAFVGTDLEQRLRAAGTRTVAIAGLTTDHCCSSTARSAADLGFEAWLIADATATYGRAAPDGGVIPADDVQRVSLASLHGEVAEVMPLAEAVARLRSA
jgi:nicotinamidase-related amidase